MAVNYFRLRSINSKYYEIFETEEEANKRRHELPGKFQQPEKYTVKEGKG